MAKIQKDYYLGLDCGTSSVGWAVTDDEYRILRAKGKNLWGVRLFDEADTAADRRISRSNRRRNQRTDRRVKLLKAIFRPEIVKVDPNFYLRLKESFYYEEDKTIPNKNTLFNDPNFTDKDYHKKYPTIWHLRRAILTASPNTHFDIRLYFLAVLHIIKNRGHFLYEGELSVTDNFDNLFIDFADTASNYGFNINDGAADKVKQVLSDKHTGKLDKKKALKDLLFIEGDEETDADTKRHAELIGLLAGSSVTLLKIFEAEEIPKDALKYSFDAGNFDEKQDEIEREIGTDRIDLIIAAKKIYDAIYLGELLGEHQNISAAMVAYYEQHQQDLKNLKTALKLHKEDYDKFFKSELFDEKYPTYNAYIGKAYVVDSNGRRSTKRVSQEDLNKQIVKLFKKHNITGDLLAQAERGELLPRQKGQAKGTIPQQLHHDELEKIIAKLALDYPSFAQKIAGEPDEYNTKCKKLLKIHSFRIPYYCGPLVSKTKSRFSWADEEINQIIYPWNFDELVDKDARANNFIRSMTNDCTYLFGEEVVPKNSLVYQKYMVLNELNNLKINGRRIDDVAIKQQIYEQAFEAGELVGNITLKKLERYLKNNGFISEGDELGGSSETKFLPQLTTHINFIKALGSDYKKHYNTEKLEEVIKLITILGQEKKMLAHKIQETLACTAEQAAKLAKFNYKDWGKFSNKFLRGIKAMMNGVEMSLLDALWQTNLNLMELLSNDFEFKTKIDEFNQPKKPTARQITYADISKLYCSPAVKRTIWQTVKIVNELIDVTGKAPTKIFVEATRDGDDQRQKGYTLSRHKQLHEIYSHIQNSDEARRLLKILDSKEPRDLQSKKLYLYFTQMGKCAYTGETIDFESLMTKAYDIDHIYPRSKTKDDSITRNLVLVKAEYNREKTNTYPIAEDWRNRMHYVWAEWYRHGLITKEKYDRLTRATPFTADELAGFVARQIVETSQSVKAIRDLLERAYPKSKIVLVKAGQVSDFRHHFSNDWKEKETGRITREGSPEFIKVRALNDFHHAKDAYLNIVVGNIMSRTFTDNPYVWMRQNSHKDFSINNHVMFNIDEQKSYGFVKGWNGSATFNVVSDTMKRNDILWTRMNYVESGPITDLQIVGKADTTDGILPIKNNDKLAHTEKYGGYRSLAGAHFALIECTDRKGEIARRIVQIPIIKQNDIASYITEKYNNSRIIIPVIKYKSLIRLNGFPMHISRKGNDGSLGSYHAVQVLFSAENCSYIKKITNTSQKIKANKEYVVDEAKDGISNDKNLELFKAFIEKLSAFDKMPLFSSKIEEIKSCSSRFAELTTLQQVETLCEFLNIFGCNATISNLSSFVPKATVLGRCVFNDNMLKYDSAELINQSITGIYEKVINLKTVQPGKI